jgi:chemotaxis protein MotA
MATTTKRAQLDLGSVAGLLVAVLGIVGGFVYEGGRPLRDMVGTSAALIVFGGSVGACLVANPPSLVRAALNHFRDIFLDPRHDLDDLVEQIVAFATKARKGGLVALDAELEDIADSYLKKTLMLAVDGADLQEIRTMMELEAETRELRWEKAARVYESAGGYAPTIGIVGAVLGLIIVMNQLQDMEKVGRGIAAAFVATIYGVGSANLFFLPAAHKLKARGHTQRERHELILEGVSAIAEGMNPKLIRIKLEGFLEKKTARQQQPAKP